MCRSQARNSRGTGKPAANQNLESMVVPTDILTATPISQTDAGNTTKVVVREYEQKFAELPEQQILTKLCSNAGFLKSRTILRYT